MESSIGCESEREGNNGLAWDERYQKTCMRECEEREIVACNDKSRTCDNVPYLQSPSCLRMLHITMTITAFRLGRRKHKLLLEYRPQIK